MTALSTAEKKNSVLTTTLLGQPLALWGALLIAACGILFCVLTQRENNELRSEAAQLKNKRLELLSYIRDARLETRQLQHDFDSLTKIESPQRRTHTPIPAKQQPVDNGSISGIDNLPLSFNRGSTIKKQVAITFDGGSYANAVDNILDTLRSRGVHATMFLTGEFIRRYPDVVVALAQNGHELGNHTDGHTHLTSYAQDNTQTILPGITRERIADELNRADRRLFAVAAIHFTPFWRSPYGEYNKTICRMAQEAGYLHIGWTQGNSWRTNLDSNDWIPEGNAQGGFKTPDQVFEKITTAARREPDGINGGIILMHLGTERKDPGTQVHLIVGRLIDELRALGYEVVPISRLVAEAGVEVGRLPVRGE